MTARVVEAQPAIARHQQGAHAQDEGQHRQEHKVSAIGRTCRRAIVENWRHKLVWVGPPKFAGFSLSRGAGGGLTRSRNRRCAASGSVPIAEKISAQFVVPIDRPIWLGGPQNAVLPPGVSSST